MSINKFVLGERLLKLTGNYQQLKCTETDACKVELYWNWCM